MEKELERLEMHIEWYLSVNNEYNRRRMISDKDLVDLIGQKLSLMEEEYEI